MSTGEANKEILKRGTMVYLPPYYRQLFLADCRGMLDKKSAFLARIIKAFYNNMSQQQRDSLLKIYNEMSEAERQNPSMK